MSTQAQMFTDDHTVDQWPKRIVWPDDLSTYHPHPAVTQAGMDAFKAIAELLDSFYLGGQPLGNVSWHARRLAGEVEIDSTYELSGLVNCVEAIRTGEKEWNLDLTAEQASFVDFTHGFLDVLKAIGVLSLPTPFRALAGALTAAVRVEPGMSEYDRLVRLRAHVTEITRAVCATSTELSPPQRRKLFDGPGLTLGISRNGAGVEQ